MAADGQIVFDIKGNNKPFKESLAETTSAINSETKKWEKSVDDSSGNIGDSLTGAFTKVATSAAFVKIAQMLIQLGSESIGLASDLEEVQNVVDVTFGAAGAAKVEKWAKSASSNFGLTELQAKKYTSSIGAMLKSSGMADDSIADMSMSLAGLTADMSSFYNLGFDDMFQKISAGLAGETEPLRRLGINMSVANLEAYALAQGIETSYDKMSQADQILLRYNYLLNATGDAQGDFARTSDSFANSQRRMQTGFDTLKAQLGEAILPIATSVSNAVNDLLDVLTYQPPETAFDVAQDSIAEAESQATQARGILGYMDKLYEKYGDAATKTEEWATALGKLKEVFPEVNKFIDAETGALTLNNAQLREYVENSKQAAIEQAKQNAVKTLNEQYVQAGMDYYTAEINRDMANEQAKEAAMALIDYIIKDFKDRGVTDKESLDRNAWWEGLQSGNIDMNYLMFEAKGAANNQGDDYSVIEEYEKIYNQQTKAASDAAKEIDSLKAKMQSLEVDLQVANAALDKLASSAATAASSLSGVQGSGVPTILPGKTPFYVNGSFAKGLDYVPFDGFIAHLHKGERIQTAAEASLSRMYGLQRPGADLGAFGAAMSASKGGSVYLDGRIVGQVVSDMQARSYKSMKRSGYQQ